jgi:ribonuclease P protein component
MIWRIRDRATFAALRHSGRRVRRGPVTITWAPGDPAEPPRVAYAIGRRVGGATVRNRVRRRLRAIVRDLQPALGPGAWLIGAAPEVANLSYGELKATVAGALDALDRGQDDGR